MKKTYFVTGTDTGVGKTLITSALTYAFAQQGLQTVAMKPVAAGCEWVGDECLSEDVVLHRQASSLKLPASAVNPYALLPPIAPHIAAQQAGVVIALDKIAQAFDALTQQADVVMVEGAGGFLVPLNEHASFADIAIRLELPVILVVGMRLGCINHALLTVEAIERRGLKLAGWVANLIDPEMSMREENLATLKDMIKAPYLGFVPKLVSASFVEAAACLDLAVLG